MKKGFLVLAALLMTAAISWAQTEAVKPSDSQVSGVMSDTDLGDFGWLKTPNITGLDTSFIDVNGWKGLEFGHAFVYLGGRRTADYLGEFSLGFATRAFSQYFALYYTGNGFPGEGSTTNTGGDDAKDAVSSKGRDNSLFSLLWGGPIGGLRFDLSVPAGDKSTDKYDGDVTSQIKKGVVLTALTWGNSVKDAPVFAGLGVLWPGKMTTTALEDGKNAVTTTGGAFFLRGGLSDVKAGSGSLGGDLRLIFGFKDTYENEADDKTNTESGGSFVLDANVNYTLAFGTGSPVEVTVKPNLYGAFWSLSGKSKAGEEEVDTGTVSGVELKPYIDADIAAGPFRNFTFYTGLRLIILDFYTTGKGEGDDNYKSTASYWKVDPLALDDSWDEESASRLRLGAKWDITKNIALGAEITSLVENFVKFNPQTFTVEPGAFWENFYVWEPFKAFAAEDALKFNLGLTAKF